MDNEINLVELRKFFPSHLFFENADDKTISEKYIQRIKNSKNLIHHFITQIMDSD